MKKALGMAFMISALAFAQNGAGLADRPHVSASGDAVIQAKPDLARIDFGVITQAATAQAAGSLAAGARAPRARSTGTSPAPRKQRSPRARGRAPRSRGRAAARHSREDAGHAASAPLSLDGVSCDFTTCEIELKVPDFFEPTSNNARQEGPQGR